MLPPLGQFATAIGHHAKATVTIRTNQKSYAPGDLVTGQVELRVTHPFNSTELVLTLGGVEKLDWCTEITSAQSEGGGVTIVKHHHKKHTLCTIQALVHACSRYEPGTLVLPFECALPRASPPSFDRSFERIELMRDVRYRVQYTLKLSVPVEDGSSNTNISATLPLQVVAASKPQQPVCETLTEPVSSLFGVVPRGNCTLTGTLAQSDFHVGELASLACHIENTSTKPVRKLKVRLYQDITVPAQKIEQELLIREAIGAEMLPSGVVTDVEVPVGMDVDREMLKHATMAPTHRGRLLQVAYRVEVKCSFRLCRSTKVDVPVVIHA